MPAILAPGCTGDLSKKEAQATITERWMLTGRSSASIQTIISRLNRSLEGLNCCARWPMQPAIRRFTSNRSKLIRNIVLEHPRSAFVGDALMGIAQIYEESLQDLDGAAAAYRELISYFPSSVLAREARAVLARFEAQLKNRPADVMISRNSTDQKTQELPGSPRLTNVRNFSGPDYARVVVDLSNEARYVERRTGNRLSIQLSSAAVSSSLSGRRFIVGEGSLLKRIVVSDGAAAQGASAANGADRYRGWLSFELFVVPALGARADRD